MSGFCDFARAEFCRLHCTEFAVLRRIEENLPNGAENVKILPIFVNPFTYNSENYIKCTTVPATLTPADICLLASR